MGLTWNDEDDEYSPEQEMSSPALRDKLNAGLCDKHFKDFRSQEKDFSIPSREIYTIILAAMVMETGANISDENIQHLRELVTQIWPCPVHTGPLSEEVSFNPARAQFVAALEYYKPGTPRDFFAAR
jgi:hypothetical protein